jgi:hypothetical protein
LVASNFAVRLEVMMLAVWLEVRNIIALEHGLAREGDGFRAIAFPLRLLASSGSAAPPV